MPEPTPVIRELREKALAASAAELGLAPDAVSTGVWGVLMELGFAQALVTLLVLADGTTSLYFGHGGGVIGAGEHAAVRAASEGLLQRAAALQKELHPAHGYPWPAVGEVRFYVKSVAGVLTAAVEEQELGEGRHPLSPLFHAGHEVITAIRQATPPDRGRAG